MTIRVMLFFLCTLAAAVTGAQPVRPAIPLAAGSPIEVSNVLLVGPEGLGLVRPGTSEKVELAWSRVDIEALGATYPELDAYRQEAILLGESTIVRAETIPNYFERFLKYPAAVRFRDDFQIAAAVQSGIRFYRADYRKITQPVRDPGFPSLIQGGRIGLGPIADASKESFEATMDRLFHDLSEHQNSRSREIVRQLVDHAELFENLKQGLRNLRDAYSEAPRIQAAIDSLDQMATDPNNSLQAQIQLREFLVYAREEAGIDPETLPYP